MRDADRAGVVNEKSQRNQWPKGRQPGRIDRQRGDQQPQEMPIEAMGMLPNMMARWDNYVTFSAIAGEASEGEHRQRRYKFSVSPCSPFWASLRCGAGRYVWGDMIVSTRYDEPPLQPVDNRSAPASEPGRYRAVPTVA
jgi:hypothetical protein